MINLIYCGRKKAPIGRSLVTLQQKRRLVRLLPSSLVFSLLTCSVSGRLVSSLLDQHCLWLPGLQSIDLLSNIAWPLVYLPAVSGSLVSCQLTCSVSDHSVIGTWEKLLSQANPTLFSLDPHCR